MTGPFSAHSSFIPDGVAASDDEWAADQDDDCGCDETGIPGLSFADQLKAIAEGAAAKRASRPGPVKERTMSRRRARRVAGR